MKLFICISLFLGLSLSVWAEEPTGFWGVKFGTTPEEVKEIMAEKEGIKLLSDSSGILTYTGVGGYWSNERIDWLSFRCHNNNMISAMISLKPIADPLYLFDEIINKLNTKYYRTKKIKRSYRSPFFAGDGHELLAISEGYATISARWKFKNTEISVHVSKELTVVVYYEDSSGVQQWINQIEKTSYKDAEMNDL